MSLKRRCLLYSLFLAVYLICAFWYIQKLPYSRYYDYKHHVYYTRVLIDQRRFPKPYEGFETWQPPLYYWLCQSVTPDSFAHIDNVRRCSAFLGAGFLMLTIFCLETVNCGIWIRLLILAYLASTPLFIQTFSAYDNDALGTLLNALVIVCAYRFWKRTNWPNWAAFSGASILALYTKFTVFIALATVVVMALVLSKRERDWPRSMLSLRASPGRLSGLALALFLALLLLIPWLYFRNYLQSGSFFPTNEATLLKDYFLSEGPWRFALGLPLVNPAEWSSPYGDIQFKRNFASVYFATSVFPGHWLIGAISYPATVNVIASVIDLFRFVVCCAVAFIALRFRFGRLLLTTVLVSAALQAALVFRLPYWWTADFRYSQWTCLLWAAIIALSFQKRQMLSDWALIGRALLVMAIAFCTILQLIFVVQATSPAI